VLVFEKDPTGIDLGHAVRLQQRNDCCIFVLPELYAQDEGNH
jgi:hypothetical protein